MAAGGEGEKEGGCLTILLTLSREGKEKRGKGHGSDSGSVGLGRTLTRPARLGSGGSDRTGPVLRQTSGRLLVPSDHKKTQRRAVILYLRG